MENHKADSDEPTRATDDDFSDIKQKIKLEEARRAAVDAELRRDKWRQKRQRAEERRDFAKKITRDKRSRNGLFRIFLVLALVLVVVVGVIVPLLGRKPETQYFATSTLEEIVKTSRLSTVDYVYKGIAVKDPENFFDSGYKVKYSSQVKTSFELSQVRFKDDGKRIVVYLPEPTMDKPVIDGTSLSFIPEGYNGDPKEFLKLCQQDAENEVASDTSIRETALENMQKTVRALVEPLVDKDHKMIEFKSLAEYAEGGSNGGSS